MCGVCVAGMKRMSEEDSNMSSESSPNKRSRAAGDMEVRLLIQSKVRRPQMQVFRHMEVRLLIQSKVRSSQIRNMEVRLLLQSKVRRLRCATWK